MHAKAADPRIRFAGVQFLSKLRKTSLWEFSLQKKKMKILFYEVLAVLCNNIMNNKVSTDIRPTWFDPSDLKWTIFIRHETSISVLKNHLKRLYISSLHFHIELKNTKRQKYSQSFAGRKVAKALLMVCHMKIACYIDFLKFWLAIIIAHTQQHGRDAE